MNQDSLVRCSWCLKTPTYTEYHDTEWGKPNHDDKIHFEFLVLESAQAGLSWLTVLNKREGYKNAFANFVPEEVALFTEKNIELLLQNPGIIRNKLKIKAAINNAQRFLEVQKDFGTFDKYIWSFVDNKAIVRSPVNLEVLPATTPESDALSKDLKKRGFKFLGSTVMYAHMQAMGLVNDHITSCFRYGELL